MGNEQKARGREIIDSAQMRLFVYRAIKGLKANKACMKSIWNNHLCNQRKGRQINNV